MARPAVLVAEPNPLQLQMIDLLLGEHDFDISMVETGEAALAYLRERTPAAAVLAVELPDIDGFALCQKIKAVRRLSRVPVVLVADAAPTGGLDDATRMRARNCGAELVLPRPLGDKNLRERLQRLIAVPADASPPTPDTADGLDDHAGVGELGPGQFSPLLGVQTASELVQLRAEVAHLRGENASLHERLAKYKALAKTLKEQLDAVRQKPKGLFGRRL